MLRLAFSGSSYVGVFARATDSIVLVRPTMDEAVRSSLEDELTVPPVATTIGGAGAVGALAAGNDTGMVVSGRATDDELARLSAETDVSVSRLPGRLNAAGNVILANDTGAVVHPDLEPAAVDTVETTLGVPVTHGTLGGVGTVGTAGVATDVGALCHPKSTEAELAAVEESLDVPADIGTINYGGPLIGSGLIANRHGYVAGEETTGPELGRIEDALGFVQ